MNRIQVCANSYGISTNHHEKVFGISQRTHNMEQCPVSGLGLSLCPSAISKHHGKTDLKSKLGEDTTFSVISRDKVWTK